MAPSGDDLLGRSHFPEGTCVCPSQSAETWIYCLSLRYGLVGRAAIPRRRGPARRDREPHQLLDEFAPEPQDAALRPLGLVAVRQRGRDVELRGVLRAERGRIYTGARW